MHDAVCVARLGATATIGPDERVQRAAHLMRSLKIECLPVLEEQRLVGIVTDADLLHIVEELPDASLALRS